MIKARRWETRTQSQANEEPMHWQDRIIVDPNVLAYASDILKSERVYLLPSV